jgi:hypothetical protein
VLQLHCALCGFGVIRGFFVTSDFFDWLIDSFILFSYLDLICLLIFGFDLLLHLITLTDTHTHTLILTHTHRHLLGTLWTRDRPLATQNIHMSNVHAIGRIRTRIPSNQAAAAATGIGDCGVTSLKVTVWEGKFDSEMNIAIEQRKAMYVHSNRVQLPYLCYVIRLCSVSSLHSASLKFPDWTMWQWYL